MPARSLVAVTVVAGASLAALLLDVWFIGRFGTRTPYWDDWNLIPYAAGRLPITWQWLWAFQNDHRIPLPKLIFVGLYKLGHADLRVIMFANLAILSGAA